MFCSFQKHAWQKRTCAKWTFYVAWNNFESCATKMLSWTLEQLGNCLHPKWKLNVKLQSCKNKLCAARYGNVWRWAKQHRRSVAVVPNAGTEHSSRVRLPAVPKGGNADNSCCTITVVCHKLWCCTTKNNVRGHIHQRSTRLFKLHLLLLTKARNCSSDAADWFLHEIGVIPHSGRKGSTCRLRLKAQVWQYKVLCNQHWIRYL